MEKISFMSASSIGIQTIMPKTGTSQQPPSQQPANDNDVDEATAAAKQAPPPPGMGKLIDKTV